MANIKITDLTAYTDPLNTDVLPIVDVTSDTTKKVSIADLLKNASAGTAAAPGISFDGDPNTGIYRPGADQVAISTNGTQRISIGSDGDINIDSGGVFYDASTNSLAIGTTSPGTTLDARGIVSIGSSSGANAILQKSAVPGGSYNLTLTGGGGLTSESATTPTDALAGSVIKLVGGNPATDPYGGGIQYYANGSTTPNAAGNGNQHVFYTRSGVNTYKERVRIDHLGGVTINADGDATQLIIKRATANQDNGLQLQDQASNTKAFFNLEGTATNRLQIGGNNEIAFFTGSTFGNPPSNERLRVDSSGRLLVGTSSARSNVYVGGSINTPSIQFEGDTFQKASLAITRVNGTPYQHFNNGSSGNNVASGNGLGIIYFNGYDGAGYRNGASISAVVDGTPGANDMPGRLVFSTTADGASFPTERMRITQTGYTTTYSTSAGYRFGVSAAAGTSTSLLIGSNSATGVDTGIVSFRVWSNGNVENKNNSYGAISDIKLKENIVDASSQWDDIKALRPVNYNFKEGQTHTQLGLIAQEVELVSPGLVSESPDRDEDGNELGTVTKSVNYSVLYMKAVKALQEAMERIEQLEQRLTDAGL